MALVPVRPLYSASATATNGSDIIQVTGNVDCSFMSSGSIVSLGTRQLTDAISGTAPDLSGNSTIKLRRPWSDPTTTAPLLAFMSREGLADAVARLRQIIDAQEGTLQGAFSYMGAWDASSGNFPPAPGEGLGSQMYRLSVAGTMGGRAYRVGEPLYYDQFTSQWRSFFELASAFGTSLLAGADAAAWRTDLDLVKTTSATDTTVGRILKVGDFGVGGISPDLLNIDDQYTATGIYKCLFTTVGNKPDLEGIVIISQMGNGDISQIFHSYTNPNRIFYRFYKTWQSIGWTPWNVSYTARNILGTVSQSAGVPTGAIIQRGSNANGEFVRFADGTQICWMVRAATATNLSDNNVGLYGWSYYFGTLIIGYPVEFIGSPSVIAAPSGAFLSVGVSTISSADCSIFTTTTVHTPVGADCYIQVVGRWI